MDHHHYSRNNSVSFCRIMDRSFTHITWNGHRYISAGAAILIILGILLVLGFVASSDASSQRAAANTRQIYRNGRCYAVHRIGDSEYFTDPETNETLRIIDDSHVINQNGESFEILDSR